MVPNAGMTTSSPEIAEPSDVLSASAKNRLKYSM